MRWADTTAGVMKMRNGANSAWIPLYELDGTFLASDISLAAGSAAAPSLFFTGDTNTGLFSPGADTVALATAGQNRLHITSGGFVGIGTTGPAVALDVVGQVNSTTGYASNRFAVNTNPLSTTSTAQSFARFTSTGGDFYVGIESSTAGAFFAGSTAYAACLYNSASTPLQFFTGGAIRATLNSTGLGIGTTGPNQLLHAQKDQAAATFARIDNQSSSGSAYAGVQLGAFGNTWGIAVGSTSANSNSLVFVLDPNTSITAGEKIRLDNSGRLLVGIIASPAHQLQVSTDSAGKPSTSTWTIVSDERIKEDIELADLDLCYEAIKAIPLKRYKWRDEIYTAEQVTDRRKLGWIAQDVETVFPKAVGTHEFKYNQVFEETIIPAVEEELDADGNVITPAQPERTEQGDLISEDVIEDCRNLNSDQIYAAMYGAVQKLMAKVETLEASNADLLARVTALEAA